MYTAQLSNMQKEVSTDRSVLSNVLINHKEKQFQHFGVKSLSGVLKLASLRYRDEKRVQSHKAVN